MPAAEAKVEECESPEETQELLTEKKYVKGHLPIVKRQKYTSRYAMIITAAIDSCSSNRANGLLPLQTSGPLEAKIC